MAGVSPLQSDLRIVMTSSLPPTFSLLPIKHASNGLMWACVRPCDCDTCCDPPSCLGVGGRALCLHDAQVKSSPLSIHKQQTPTKGRQEPLLGAPIYRMCSGSQLWWKGVGGDDVGDPSRGDTSHELTYSASTLGSLVVHSVCTCV